MAILQTYAEQHSLTVDQAATQLVKEALALRYRRIKKVGAKVIQLRSAK